MSFTTGAWIGIGVGLLLAIVEYVFVINIARQSVKSDDPEEIDQESVAPQSAIRRLFTATRIAAMHVNAIIHRWWSAIDTNDATVR